MKQFHPQFVIDENHDRKSVILSIDEWQEIVNAMEEFEEIQAYDYAKKLNDEIIPFERAVKEIENSQN